MSIPKTSSFSSYTLAFQKDDAIMGVSTAGGGGHLSALNAIKLEYFKQNPLGDFLDIDIIKNSFPCYSHKLVGRLIKNWDDAKKRGDIRAQEYILQGKIFGISRRRWSDIVFFIPVFLSTFFTLLFDGKITHIVDTQPVSTNAVIRAARLVNWVFHRKIVILKVMTDFPSEDAIHFSHSAKLLTENDKKIFRLVTTAPFGKMTGEREGDYVYRQEHWWNQHFGLSLEKGEVLYSEFPIRSAFKQWQYKPAEERSNVLQVKLNNEDEFEKLNSLIGNVEKKSVKYGDGRKENKNVSYLSVEEKEVVGVITIGSQASKKTKQYVIDFIELIRNHGDPEKKYTFFVGCSYHSPNTQSLYKDVYDEIKGTQDLPQNLRIVPMGYQDDDELAPLFHRADFGVYGAGGQTQMEVNKVARGKVFIHSDADPSIGDLMNEDEIQKELLKGIGLWEKGNAKYQINAVGATLIAPGSCFSAGLRALGLLNGEEQRDVA